MKHTLVPLLLTFLSIGAFAQTNILFADIGISGGGGKAGFSATYNYRFSKHWGAGAGVQDYSYPSIVPGNEQFLPGAFGDLRYYSRSKKSSLFVFLDIGVNFYKVDPYYPPNTSAYELINDNGLYTGLGLGYFRAITKHGSGPYASFKIISNRYTSDVYSSGSHTHSSELDATVALSIGFKF